ncbi:AfsR/SARP family transcriptional regulator [Actinophytocola gossypii]|uniref:AfsR/SARP family transcriptional regulator n=1 Tax=Actinophytocola gossypii TaxID=2812003 RepID=UPI0021A625B6|nr:BTAD domain-containing putative transcriptional regulator [Actinophytocola gossypii]
MAVRIQVLGSLRVWRDGGELDLGPPARRAVLGLLVLGGGETVTTRALVDALWGDQPPRSAVNVVQTHVKHLRRLLEPDRPSRTGSVLLPHVNGGYALNQDAVDVDLARVRRLLAEADHDGDRAAASLGEALRLWHGPPLADIPMLATQPKVVALVAERRKVLARYGDVMIANGAATEVLPDIAAAAAEQPFDEPAQARLIRAYHAVGLRATAFQVYHDVRDRLVEELGIDPGPELRAAHTALLHPDAGPATDPLPAPRVPRQLPAEPPGFTGRVDQLSVLDRLLPRSGTGGAVTIAAISGTAGVGKTALAVHWAHRVRDRFPDGELYANLRGHAHGPPARPIEILTQFLLALGIPAERAPADLETASALYRTMMTGRKTLVLLDNVAGPDQVRPLLPAGAGSMVVVTGRDQLSGLVATHGAHQLTLTVLSPDDALELLARVLGAERVLAEPEPAAEFAKLCVYLPLALRIAAANLADHPWLGIEDHVLELRDGNLLAALAVQGDEQTAVRTAFDLSYAALPDAARRVFRLLSLVPGTDVSTEAVAALASTDPREAGALLHQLAGAHLVEHYAPGRYRFHDLLRRYAAEQPEPERDTALDRLYDWYLHAVDAAARLLYPHMLRLPVPVTETRAPSAVTDPATASGWLDTERGNLVAAIQHAGSRPVAWLLADALRGYFWMCARKVDWQTAAEAGLAAAEAAGDPMALAAARLSLADLNFRQGRARLAVRHHTHALLYARRAGWPEAQAAVQGNLGLVHRRSGRLTSAAARFGRGLTLSRAIGQTAGEAVALGNLGLVHWEMGRLALAADHHAQALRGHRRVGSRYGEALSLSHLGQAQRSRGLLTEAADVLTRAVELYREAGARAGEAEARGRLAATHADLGRRAAALDHARAAFELARETGDPRATAETLATLAAVHHGLGNRPEAVGRYRQALDLIRETGDRYPEVDALIGLAVAAGEVGTARHALVLAEHAGFRALRGLALTALAELHLTRHEPADAAEYARQALTEHRETGHRLGAERTEAVLARAPRAG